jgi:hypothetical protein
MTKFYNVKIDDLTDSECRELLRKIEGLVGDMPSFVERNQDGGYGQVYARYSCCRSNANQGHGKNCSVGKLKDIFGY